MSSIVGEHNGLLKGNFKGEENVPGKKITPTKKV